MSIGPLGPVSFQGIGTGLNVQQIVQQMTAVDQLPLQQLAQQEGQLTSQATAWGNVESALQSFLSAAQAITPSLFQEMSATSSLPSVVTASATSGAVAASYQIDVTALAQPEIDASAGFASATASLGLSGTFTVNGVSVNVSTSDSLTTIAENINAAGAGVSAAVIDTGAASNPYELWITSNGTGTQNAIAYQDTSGTPLVGLGILTSTGTKADVVQAAQNAAFTVDGAAFQSGSDTVTQALPGITLNLLAPGSATVTVAPDTAAMTGAVQSFVSAYNGLVQTFQQDLAPTGPLAGNATLQSLWNTLAETLFSPVATGSAAVASLSDVGLSFVPVQPGSSANGTIQFDSAAFTNQLAANPGAVTALFTGTGGIVAQIQSMLNDYVSPGGVIAQVQNTITAEENTLQSEQQAIQQYITQEQNTLTQEFNDMASLISQYQAQGQLLNLFGSGLTASSPGTGSSGSGAAGGTSSLP